MRILAALALLGVTASCIAPPPEAPALAPAPAPPAPSAPSPPVAALYMPNPWPWLFPAVAFAPEPGPGRMTLSNYTFDNPRVQAVVTPYPDCQERPGAAVSEFELPLNGTRIIAAPPGADVCWRRALPPGPSPTRPGTEIVSGWTDWSRVFTSSGRSIDSQL